MYRKDILKRKEEIVKWIKEEKPKNFICRELKCRPTTLNVYLKSVNIEYEGKSNWSKNKKFPDRLVPATEYLKKGTLIGSHTLKNKLFRDGIKEKKCERCKISKWNKIEAPLELHHIDGDKHNNELSNLQILCSNCHSQTSNFNRPKIDRKKRYYCSCGNEIHKLSKNCTICDKIKQRKVKDRPSTELLLKEISETSYVAVGKKYGVSDNAIRKWVKTKQL